MKYHYGAEDQKHTMEGRDNNEKFNALLNSCANPRQIYNALLALAEAGYPLKSLNQNLEDVARQKGVAGG